MRHWYPFLTVVFAFVLLILNSTEAAACYKVNGACGAANGVAVTSAPTTGFCSHGIRSAVTGSGPWSWSCAGRCGGTTAQCSAPLFGSVVNGACGPANGVAESSTPTTGLCSAGPASAVSGSGPWSWSCAGGNGGTSAQCSALLGSANTYTYDLVKNFGAAPNNTATT